MSNQLSDKTIAVKIASIIRKTLNSHQSGSIAIDWADQENLKNIDDCLGQVPDIDPILRDNFSGVEILKRLKTQIEGLLQEFVASSISIIGTQEEKKIASSIKNWRATLAAQHELRTFYAVIDGVSVESKLSIGLVAVTPMSQSIRQRIISQFASRVRKSPNFDKEHGRSVIGEFRKRISEFLTEKDRVNSVVVSTVVDTWDDGVGTAIAYERFEEVTNFIRYMGHLFNQRPGRMGVALRGELGHDGKSILGMSDRLLFSHHFSASHFQVSLSKGVLARAQGIVAVLKIPAHERNEFEQKIVSAINWIGKGCVEVESGDQLVSFCIALEVLLKGENRYAYTNVICERVSFLLANSVVQQFKRDDIVCDRRSLCDLVREAFNNRGSVVHSGQMKLDADSRQYIGLMPIILFHVIITIRILYKRNKWIDMKPMFELLAERKFGLRPLPQRQA